MTDFWKDSPELNARLERVSAVMMETVRSPEFPLAEAVAAIVQSNGKMLRPALLLIGSGFGRAADQNRIVSLAAAVELLHVATLIHDDVLDEAELRRGLPTLHTTFGHKDAVLAGDWLLSRCFRLASASAAPDNAQALARLVGAICAAEIGQDLAKYSYSGSVRRYLRTIAGKTAALFSLALHAGATEAKAPNRIIQTVRRAGYNIGMAFQIIDDILDFESSTDVMRKPVGKDLREGLCTLPLIFALRRDPAGLAPRLASMKPTADGHEGPAAPRPDDAELARLVEQVTATGALDQARDTARHFTQRAQTEIESLPLSSAKMELQSLARSLLSRRY
ncbi:MAG TPA: polyprenyl synthetase family protein [Rectinemataceae bacterium]|nr:polyprenyl synthetase family protein [Rectinemataceae bacterium]